MFCKYCRVGSKLLIKFLIELEGYNRGLATPQNVFLGGKIDKKCRNSVTAYRRGMIYGSKFAELSCFYMC